MRVKIPSAVFHWLAGLLWGVALSVSVQPAFGADQTPPADAVNGAATFPASAFLTQRETWLAMSVLVFGVIMLFGARSFIPKENYTSADVIRLASIILIVSGTLFLVTAGYSAQQISPALGILGTVAGYILGRGDRQDTKKDE